MKEKYQRPEDSGGYTGDTHPFGRTEGEMPALKTRGERFSYWFKNKFWFHYKWYVAGGVLLAFLAGLFIHDLATNLKPDFQFVLASNYPINEDSVAELTGLAQELFGDLNGDGRVYGFGHAMFMKAEGEMSVAMYSKMATFFVDADIRLFIFDSELYESYFSEPGGFVDISGSYETVPGRPWLVELTGLPILERNGITGADYYAAIQVAKKRDKNPELSEGQCLELIGAILTAP